MSEEKTIIADAGNLTIFNPPKRKRACLIQYNGNKLGQRYPLAESSIVIGRAPESQICIAEASVSRQHAKFVQSDQTVEIEDLRSSNGTFVNDQRVEAKAVLKDGDMIRLGTIIFKFFAHDNVESIMADKIYQMATIDAGTKIFNKQYLLDTLEQEFKFSKLYQRNLSIIYYDLDFFKKVNDTYGHNAGDTILRESAAVVKAAVRKDDILGRFGGEEFVVILPNTDQKTAADLAERIRQTIALQGFHLEVDGPQGRQTVLYKQTVSMGVTQLAADMPNTKALLESADKKLYNSKQTGRNKVTV